MKPQEKTEPPKANVHSEETEDQDTNAGGTNAKKLLGGICGKEERERAAPVEPRENVSQEPSRKSILRRRYPVQLMIK